MFRLSNRALALIVPTPTVPVPKLLNVLLTLVPPDVNVIRLVVRLMLKLSGMGVFGEAANDF